MSAEIGQLALTLSLALSVLLSITGLVGIREGAILAQRLSQTCAYGLMGFVLISFAALVYASVTSDFSVLNIANNSSLTKPLLYKITGTWGNHEGSMLLWIVILGLYTGAMAYSQCGGARLTSGALGIQGLLTAAFLIFILFTSNPFLRIDPPPFDGLGLNPLLQDIGLAIHPPSLYLGYVGLSATFAYAAAALMLGSAGQSWARAARPFILAAWSTLTIGITLGSWWAYYELGWGGFWFWDPVENASLMPWLIATALLHSAMATERTGAFRSWTILLAIAGFSLSLIGTFLVRSGVLTSVHSFANDPERGVYILILLVLVIGAALALFAWRAPALSSGSSFETSSRETSILLNNVLFTAATVTVFLGTLYPLFLDALNGTKISVGPPYFALTFVPIAALLLILLPLGPRLRWGAASLPDVLRALWPAFGLAMLIGLLILSLVSVQRLASAACFALAAWVIVATLHDLSRRRVKRAAAFAVALAHAGVGISLMGIAGTTLWRAETLALLAPGDVTHVGPYQLRFITAHRQQGANFTAIRAQIDVSKNGESIATLSPATRLYTVEGQETSETAIRTTGFSDLYLALGDERGTGKFILRAYHNPLAPFIWIGGAIMSLGGLIAFAGRMRRSGAGTV